MKLSILILIVIIESAFATEACDNPKEPVKILKFTDLKIYDPIEQFIHNHVKYLCPVESAKDIENLDKTPAQYSYEFNYCLFVKPFEEGDKTECSREAKPIFIPVRDKNHKRKRCGTKNQHLYNMGYYHCGDENTLQKFEDEKIQQNPAELGNFIENMRIYDVCYDTNDNKAVWTRHTIQHPGLFQDDVDERERYCVEDIRTDPFFMDTDVFEELKHKYEENKKKLIKGHRIVPQYLVPLQHLSLKMWKKTANHYINTAPIRQNLVPLMTAIDEGIKRAGQKIYNQDDKKINDLLIFTKVVTQTSIASMLKRLFFMKTTEIRIWYKVVYSYTTKKVLTIIIHDTSEKFKKIKCTEVVCNFQEWTRNKDVKKGISRDKKKHAYCCKFKEKEINEIFSFDLPSEGLLDIHTMITEE